MLMIILIVLIVAAFQAALPDPSRVAHCTDYRMCDVHLRGEAPLPPETSLLA